MVPDLGVELSDCVKTRGRCLWSGSNFTDILVNILIIYFHSIALHLYQLQMGNELQCLSFRGNET